MEKNKKFEKYEFFYEGIIRGSSRCILKFSETGGIRNDLLLGMKGQMKVRKSMEQSKKIK